MCESRAVGGEEAPRREVRRVSSRSLMMYTAMNKSHLLNTSLASLYVEWRYQIDDFALRSDLPKRNANHSLRPTPFKQAFVDKCRELITRSVISLHDTSTQHEPACYLMQLPLIGRACYNLSLVQPHHRLDPTTHIITSRTRRLFALRHELERVPSSVHPCISGQHITAG